MSGDPIRDLILDLIYQGQTRASNAPPIVGVAGAQGSGKSYQCRVIARVNPNVLHLSLDDYYMGKAARARLAAQVHPLFLTRGPPGTHYPRSLLYTLQHLNSADEVTELPRFDKARDDIVPQDEWSTFRGKPDAILVDGWCLGLKDCDALTDDPPLNALEAEEDSDGRYRRAVRRALDDYVDLFREIRSYVYLQAPSWDVVRKWRGEQEEETLGRRLNAADEKRLDRFVMHYERITRAMLAGHHRARWIVHLDEKRRVVRVEGR